MSAPGGTQTIKDTTIAVPHPAKRVYARRLGLPWGIIAVGESFRHPWSALSLRARQQRATNSAAQRRRQTNGREVYSCCIVEEEGERIIRITRMK